MDEPTPPRLGDYGLTKESFNFYESLTSAIGHSSWVIGGVIGAIYPIVTWVISLYPSYFSAEELVEKSVITVVLGSIGFVVGMLLGTFLMFRILRPILRPIVSKIPIVKKIESYKYDVERHKVIHRLESRDKERYEREEAIQKQRIAEYERLKSDWERAIHSRLYERDRFSKDGVLRIKGTKLLSLIDWSQFEVVLTHILRHRGWQARTTSRGADGGVDVEGTRGTEKLYLQAKHYKSGTNVGRPALQMLMGVAQSKGATHAVLATSSDFTRQAKNEPTNNLNYRLELWDGRKVATRIDALSTEVYEAMIEPMKRDLLRSL